MPIDGSEISGLPNLAAVDASPGVLIPVVDVTDTAQAPTGTNKYMTLADLLSLAGGIVITGPATHFSVSAPGSVTTDVAFTVTVTALDASNVTATGYTGTVTFTSTDGTATLPADATLTAGVGSFSVTIGTDGTFTVTATDTIDSGITGTSGNIVSAGAGSWDPTSLSNCIGWWDASNAGSITGSPKVSQWNDLSAAGNHLTQGTDANRFRTGVVTHNGLNCLETFWVGNITWMARSITTISQPFTIAFVYQLDNTTNQHGRLLHTPGPCLMEANNGDGTLAMYDGTNLNGGTKNTNASIWLAVFGHTTSKSYYNGASIGTGSISGTASGTTLSIGSDGGWESATSQTDGVLMEINLWTGDKSANQAAIFAGLNAKWAIY